MVFIKWFKKDLNKRKFFGKVELKKLIIMSLIANRVNKRYLKYHYYTLMQRFEKSSSLAIYRNGCTITGSSKSIFRYFGVSRFVLKHLFSNGIAVGVRTSSF